MITVNGPNGVTVNFPEGTDAATIDKVMREKVGGGGAPAAEQSVLGKAHAEGAKALSGDVQAVKDAFTLGGAEPPSLGRTGRGLLSAVGAPFAYPYAALASLLAQGEAGATRAIGRAAGAENIPSSEEVYNRSLPEVEAALMAQGARGPTAIGSEAAKLTEAAKATAASADAVTGTPTQSTAFGDFLREHAPWVAAEAVGHMIGLPWVATAAKGMQRANIIAKALRGEAPEAAAAEAARAPTRPTGPEVSQPRDTNIWGNIPREPPPAPPQGPAPQLALPSPDWGLGPHMADQGPRYPTGPIPQPAPATEPLALPPPGPIQAGPPAPQLALPPPAPGPSSAFPGPQGGPPIAPQAPTVPLGLPSPNSFPIPMGMGPQPLALPKPPAYALPDVMRPPAITPQAPAAAAAEPVTVAKAITKANGKVKVTPAPSADDLDIPDFLKRNPDNTLPASTVTPAPVAAPPPPVTAEVPAPMTDAARDALFARAKPGLVNGTRPNLNAAPDALDEAAAAMQKVQAARALKKAAAPDITARLKAAEAPAPPAPVAAEAPVEAPSYPTNTVQYQGKPLDLRTHPDTAGLNPWEAAGKLLENAKAAGKEIKNENNWRQGVTKYLTEKLAAAMKLSDVTGIPTPALDAHLRALGTQTEARAWLNELRRRAPKSQKKGISDAVSEALIARWWRNKP